MERINIISTLLPLRYHWRLFPPQFSCRPRRRQELESNSWPVFWSFNGSHYLARCRFSMTQMIQRRAGDREIMAPMWIECQIDPCPVWFSGIWTASSISFYLNPEAADAICQAAKADRRCREGIARSVCGLGGHLEFTEHQYYCPPAFPSEYASLLSDRVVSRWNAPSRHLSEFVTLGTSHMRLE